MADPETRIVELETENASLKNERLELQKLVDQLRSLMNSHINRDPRDIAADFERDIYDTAIRLLSNGRFDGMNDEVLTYIQQNSPTADEVLCRFGRKAS